MQRTLFFLVLISLPLFAGAQSLKPTVIGTLGGYSAPSGGPSLSYNMGETFIATLTGGSTVLYEGFEEPPSVLPSINGILTVCTGSTTTLTDATTGGTWSSSNDAIASVGSTTGTVTGNTAGTATISYTVAGGSATTVVTVNPSPTIYSVTGGGSYCAGTGGVAINLSSSDTGVNYNLYLASTFVSSVAGWGSSFTFGYFSATGDYSVVAINATTSCTSNMSGSSFVLSNPSPSVIAGTTYACAGSSTSLSDATAGGTWSSSNSNASVGTSGMVSGISAGTDIITYTLISGCLTTTVVTVNPLPVVVPVTGLSTVSVSSNINLTDATTGGMWSSSNTSVATAGSTGIVNGVAAGTATISYTVTNGSCSASATLVVTVTNASIAAITGPSSVCAGSTISLTDATTGGTWASSNTAKATVVSTTGVVTGVAAGTATITYAIGSSNVTTTITVNAAPAAISGTGSVCTGATTTLTDATTGGAWSVDGSGNASIGTTGIVTGITAGTAGVSYTAATGCVRTAVVTVNQIPAALTGTGLICPLSSLTLSDAITGGTWASSSTAIATVATTGMVTGVAGGTATISYTLTGACRATAVVTVITLPAITGTASVCTGSTTTLADATTGGTWSIDGSGNASIGTTGIVTGITAGTAAVSYMAITGCMRTVLVTVNQLPTAIIGANTVCTAATTDLTDAVTGGTWASSATTKATVGAATGVVTGVAAGTTTISYTIAASCRTTVIVTVIASPAAITGGTIVCVGQTTNLSDVTTGAAWSIDGSGNASIGTTGIVTGIAAGTSGITYTAAATGCMTVATVTVHAVPTAINGTSDVCTTLTTHLTDAVAGGTWSSSNNTIGTVGSTTGTVAGIAGGTITISYMITASCYSTDIVTVNTVVPSAPAGITGTNTLNIGTTSIYNDITAGGTWGMSDTAVAVVNSPGMITAVGSGTTVISYSLTNGCGTTSAAYNLTVATSPIINTIAGTGTAGYNGDGIPGNTAEINFTLYGHPTTMAVDAGGSLIFPDVENYRVRKIDNTGIITTIAGNGTRGHSGDGGFATVAELMQPDGVAIDLSGNIYEGDLYTGIEGSREINSAGIISTFAGTCDGCAIGDGGPATSAGIGDIYGIAADASGNVYLSDYVHDRVREITTDGIIHTIAGNGTSGYSGDGGPAISAQIENAQGIAVDVAGNVYFVDATSAVVRKISTSGIITTVAGSGTGFCNGRAATAVALNGPWSVTLDVAGNIYISERGGGYVEMVNSAGMITRIAGGGSPGAGGDGGPALGAGLTYPVGITVDGSGNLYIAQDNYNVIRKVGGIAPGLASVTGAAAVCAGATTIFSDATGGGSWSSSNTAVAAIDPGSGLATGISGGTVIISYAIGTFVSTAALTVNPLPDAGAITGPSVLSVGANISLTDSITGGAWTSSNGNATVSGGLVTGVAAGTVVISYTLSNGCGSASATAPIIVNSTTITPITGTATVCTGSTTTLTDATTGGTWSSSNTNATIDGSGDVTGVAAGTATISYTVAGGSAITVVTVNGSPTVNSLSPSMGYPASSVTITGTNFSSTTANDIVFFGATQATVSAASATSLSVTVPAGATYMPVSVLNTGCALTGYSDGPYLPTFNNVAGGINFDGQINFTTGTSPYCIAIGDIDGDGKPDIAVVNQLDNTVSVLRNISSSGFITSASFATQVTFATGVEPVAVSIGDINGDGKPDLVVVNTSDNTVSVLRNTSSIGSISFATQVAFDVNSSGPCAVVIGDIDGDGKPDLAIANYEDNKISVLRNTSSLGSITTSSFASPVRFFVGNEPAALAFGDIDGDGKPDLAVANFGDNTVSVLHNTSSVGSITTSSFASQVIFTGNHAYGVAIEDVDGDGKPDLVVTNAGDGDSAVSVFRNTSSLGSITTSSFAPQVRFFVGYESGDQFIVMADVDGDGKPDLAGINPSNNTISILRNTATIGSVSFASQETFAIGNQPLSLAMGDLDGDGKPDIAVASYGDNSVSILRNDPLIGILGIPSLCAGTITTLTDATTGGIWSSSNGAIANVGSTTGIVTGNTAGTATISYTVAGGSATTVVTVNPSPTIYSVTGGGSYCAGTGGVAINLSSSDTGVNYNLYLAGTFVSSVAGWGSSFTFGYFSATGDYSVVAINATTSCTSNMSGSSFVLSNPSPSVIAGTTYACAGSSTSLSDATAGGTWSSSNSNASVGTNGMVSGISAGTDVITYTLISGCLTTTVVTVNPLPVVAPITGPATVSTGSTINLTDATTGGMWSSSNTSVATAGSTGIVNSVAAGTATISYTVTNGSCGASATLVVTVTNASIAAITGPSSVCAGSTISLTDATTGGTWASSNTAKATVVSTTGVVTGVAAGTATITYAIGSSNVTTTITVNAAPAAISGTGSVCTGATTTLTDATTGGAWSSSDANATVGTGAGLVTGASAGTAVITYTLPTGCYKTDAVTVNATPTAISGAGSVCVGLTLSLSDGTSGGAWASSNTAKATVVATTGIVTGVAAGTAIISYTLGSCRATGIITVNAVPAAITGTASVCTGLTTALTDATTGGIWENSSPNGTVNATGAVTGVSAGTTAITYLLATGCYKTDVVTVNPAANAGVISGPSTVCAGSSINLTDASSGGTWSSSAAAVATVGTNGLINGVSGGISTITYKVTNTCGTALTTQAVTVNALPGAGTIAGADSVMAGAMVTLTDAATGGVWSSGNNAVATAGSETGMINGIAVGTVLISYTVNNGCGSASATIIVTVTPSISVYPVTGAGAVCTGATLTLSDITTGGAWSSGNTAIATVDPATGIVTGISAGTAIISYSTGAGAASAVVTVTTVPSENPVTGTLSVCVGSTTSLSDATAGGFWFSGDNTIATINSAGVVTGISSGNVSVNYAVSNSCGVNEQAATITVYDLSSISGITSVCAGASSTLSNSTTGGTWSSSNSAVASIGSASGILTGTSAGTSIITYSISSGCRSTVIVSVTAGPGVSSITGPSIVTVGSVIALTDAISGGSWSSEFTALATVDGYGHVTGSSAGVDSIYYSVTNSCFTSVASYAVTVNSITIAPITGNVAICGGTTIALSDVTAGGAWSSSNTSVATVSTAGIVTGTGAGTATVSYSLYTSVATVVVTINQAPAAISGSNTICAGTTATLADTVSGGIWSSNLPSVATISPGGVLSGVIGGAVTISYTIGSCAAALAVTVNPAVATITGPSVVCVGATTTLNDAMAGGIWASSNPAAGTIDPTYGIFDGISAGAAVVTYALPTGCYKTINISVAPPPSAIMGATTVCAGATTALSDATSGSTGWASSNTTIATVLNSGVVTGVAAGTATIIYTISTGCSITTGVTVNGLPGAITGNSSPVCAGAALPLTDAGGAGAWSSSNVSAATVGPASGIVTGIAGGTTLITYLAGSSGCATTVIVSVTAILPISGSNVTCAGSGTTLSDGTAGGVWSSDNTAVAAIGSATGIVTGGAGGVANITYLVAASGCSRTVAVTVNASSASVSGASSVCLGSATTLSDAAPGGIWSSGNVAIATVGSTGIVTPVNPGVVNITYTLGAGCSGFLTVSVNAGPAVITGAVGGICTGSTALLSDVTAGGAWSSIGAAGTVDVSGNVSGISAGTVTVSYQLPTGCATSRNITINPLPSSIMGTPTICAGATTALSDATSGATGWASSNTGYATVLNSGVVTGVAAGTSTIIYTIATGCSISTTVTVIALPDPITGNTPVCAGSTITLSDPDGSGMWASSNATIASAGSSTGVVTGIAGGMATITYTAATGCVTSLVVTVSPILPITGNTTACVGTTTTLSSASAGGTWSSSNTAVATIGSSGIVTGIAAGTATMVYTLGTGCTRPAIVTIVPMYAITGSSTLCAGATTTLSDLTTGGTWASNEPSIASVGSTGIVTGSVPGAATITYSASGCKVTMTETVLASPATITGSMSVCIGSATTLADAATGGTWSGGSAGTGTINPVAGTVTGIAAGSTVITYTTANGCFKTSNITVNVLPAGITGTPIVCPGGTTALTDITTGAVSWTSSNTSFATVLNSGVVTGVATGTVNITYKISSGCMATATVTVISSPSPVIGPFNVCAGSAIALTDTSGSGTWSINSTAFATIGSSSGIVTGTAAGAPIITFTLSSTGCKTEAVATVTAIPNAGSLTGAASVVIGAYDTIKSNGTAGGAWSSSNTSLATVGTSGIVTGVGAGLCTITYAVSNACGYSGAYKTISVGTAPPHHVGSGGTVVITTGAMANLNEGLFAGIWASSDTGIATVDVSGIITGIAPGTAGITHIMNDNEGGITTTTTTVVVNPLPMDIRVVPNPNGGAFTVRGTLGTAGDEEVALEITDVLGQVIYKRKVMAQNGVVNEQVQLYNSLANGMYILNVKSGAEHKVFHFVVEK